MKGWRALVRRVSFKMLLFSSGKKKMEIGIRIIAAKMAGHVS